MLRRRDRRGVLTLVAVGLGVLAILVAWPRLMRDPAAKRSAAAEESCRQSESACRAGRYLEAVEHGESALRLEPEHAEGYARRARAKYFLGDEHGTLADCDEAIRHDPALAVAYAYRAPVAYLHRAPAAGIKDGERALELVPDSIEYLTCLALARLNAGDLAGALGVLDKAMTLSGTDAEAYRVRGLVLAAQGFDRARDDFDTAVRLSGEQPYYRLARANYLLSRVVSVNRGVGEQLLIRASDDIKAVLAADPDCALAYLAWAEVQAHREREFDRVAACEKAVAANPRLFSAYLRAAEDLSPRDLKRFELLQEALAADIDLRELKGGGDFAFGAIVTDLQRLASGRVKQPVPVYINYLSFPPEQRTTLRDAKVNLNTLMDVSGENLLQAVSFGSMLDTICRQVSATYWVTAEYIEIVERKLAPVDAPALPRIVPIELIAPSKMYKREERVLLFEQALQQTIDLRELKSSDFAFGAILTDVQRVISAAMHTEIPLYINFNSFPPEHRLTLRDMKVNLNILLDVSGENPLPSIKVWKVLDLLVREIPNEVKIAVTPDYIEIAATRKLDDEEPSWRPLGLKSRRRPEAIRWLSRGIEQVPTSAELYRARGKIRLEQFELEAAIADLTAAIERNPADRQAYRLRSLAYMARGKTEDGPLARLDALATRP